MSEESLADFFDHLAEVQREFEAARATKDTDPERWGAAKVRMRQTREYWRSIDQGLEVPGGE